MQIGLTLPTMIDGLDRATVLDWCRRIDRGPWSTLAAGERIAYPNIELFTTMAAAAAVTERVRLATTVSVLPMHPAVGIAKQAATIDVLSDGRFTLGVGIGGRDEDYRAVEGPYGRRHQRLDDQVVTLRRVWAGESPMDGVAPVGPRPVQTGGPPLWAGALGPLALARAARWADGNAGFLLDPSAPKAADPVAATNQAWQDAGRTDAPWNVTTFWFGIGAGADARTHDYAFRYLQIFGDDVARSMAAMVTTTSVPALRQALERCEEAGYDEVILVPTSADADQVDELASLAS